MDCFLVNVFLVLTGATVITGVVEITFDPEYYHPGLDKVKLNCDFSDENPGTIRQLRWLKQATPDDKVVYEYKPTNSLNTPGPDYINRLEDYDTTPVTFHSLVINGLDYCDMGSYQCSGLGDGQNVFSKLELFRGLMMELDGTTLDSNKTLDQGATGIVKCIATGPDDTVKAIVTKGNDNPVEGTAQAIPNSNNCGFRADAEVSFELNTETTIEFTCTSMIPNQNDASISYLISTETFPTSEGTDEPTDPPTEPPTQKPPVENGVGPFHMNFICVTLAMVVGAPVL